MPWNTPSRLWSAAATRFVMGAVLAALMSGCSATMSGGSAGCTSYAEARLARPPAGTVRNVPPAWAGWIADLDDRMTGTCR